MSSIEYDASGTPGRDATSGPLAPRPPPCRPQSYLSQGLPGFRGDLPEWSYQQVFHRYWWPRFIARIGERAGHSVIETVTWVDEPGDHADRVLVAAREAFMLC